MSNLEVELIRHKLEQQTSVLVTKDLLLTSTTVSNYATEITIHTYIHTFIHCQYCGSADHQSSACPQAEVCHMSKTKNHRSIYICPLLKEVNNQESTIKVTNMIQF